MSNHDYQDYKAQRPRKHRLTVGEATFIVTSNVDGNKRWIREVHHVRRHRSGSSAVVCIYPNDGRKPSATLSSLWTHLGVDPIARWKECAADHPAFRARRSIGTALDQADDDRKSRAAAVVLLAAGWTWAEGENERWIAPPAQGIDLGKLRDAARYRWLREEYDPSIHDDEFTPLFGLGPDRFDAEIDALIDQRDAAPGVGNG